MKVLIVGCGIGGLTTALCLHERGIECELYEQSGNIRELGVGINTLPNAIKELADLGLLPALDAVSIRTYELIMTNRFGQQIWRELRGLDAGYAVPQLSLHRGRLQGVLNQAVRQRLGDDAVHVGHRLVGFEQDARWVRARFVDRDDAPLAEVEGDALVAADGIHSTARALLYPNEGPPRWNGVMMWRGAHEWPKFLTGRSMIIAGGTAAKLVLYPIGPGATPDTRLTNWAVCAQIAEPGAVPPRRENWARPGQWDELAPHLARFNISQLDLPALVAATPEFFEYPMCDRDPLPAWSFGRMTLLGDAAHPMYPMGSNGASQAILDARCLARLLSEISGTGDVPAALKAYEDERLQMTAQIVHMNRTGGPEGVIDVVERLAPDGFADVDDVISHSQRQAILKGYATAAGFSREQVNR